VYGRPGVKRSVNQTTGRSNVQTFFWLVDAVALNMNAEARKRGEEVTNKDAEVPETVAEV
jgi:hypothetical protein